MAEVICEQCKQAEATLMVSTGTGWHQQWYVVCGTCAAELPEGTPKVELVLGAVPVALSKDELRYVRRLVSQRAASHPETHPEAVTILAKLDQLGEAPSSAALDAEYAHTVETWAEYQRRRAGGPGGVV